MGEAQQCEAMPNVGGDGRSKQKSNPNVGPVAALIRRHTCVHASSLSSRLDVFMNTGPLRFARLYTTRSRAIGRGQNLADRYVRLENSLREKQALQTNINSLRDESIHQQESLPTAAPKKGNIFRGLVVPEKPAEPASDGASSNAASDP